MVLAKVSIQYCYSVIFVSNKTHKVIRIELYPPLSNTTVKHKLHKGNIFLLQTNSCMLVLSKDYFTSVYQCQRVGPNQNVQRSIFSILQTLLILSILPKLEFHRCFYFWKSVVATKRTNIYFIFLSAFPALMFSPLDGGQWYRVAALVGLLEQAPSSRLPHSGSSPGVCPAGGRWEKVAK